MSEFYYKRYTTAKPVMVQKANVIVWFQGPQLCTQSGLIRTILEHEERMARWDPLIPTQGGYCAKYAWDWWSQCPSNEAPFPAWHTGTNSWQKPQAWLSRVFCDRVVHFMPSIWWERQYPAQWGVRQHSCLRAWVLPVLTLSSNPSPLLGQGFCLFTLFPNLNGKIWFVHFPF